MSYYENEVSKEVKRGEVYYIRLDGGIGSMQGIGRPVVIVSSEYGCEVSPVVTAAYMTTSPKRMNVAVETHSTGRASWVLCNQLVTVDKIMLERNLGTLTDEEMGRVEKALCISLGLEKEEQAKEKEIEIEKPQENVSDNIELRLEADTYKKLYEKALEKIVELSFQKDAAEEKEEESPFANINTATWEELSEKAGINEVVARQIVSYRKMNGSYESLEDLLKVKRFGPLSLEKYKEFLIV